MTPMEKLEILIHEMNLEEDILSHYEEISEDYVVMKPKDVVRLILDISVTENNPFFMTKAMDDKTLEANSPFAEVLMGLISDKEAYWTKAEKRFTVETLVSIVWGRDLSTKEKKVVNDVCYVTDFFEENRPFTKSAKEFYLRFTDYDIFEQESRRNVLDSVRLCLMLIRGEHKELLLSEFEKFMDFIWDRCSLEEHKTVKKIYSILKKYDD